jgi:hypothetical protein
VQERNFCERCGKRLGSGIHTCTPFAAQRQWVDLTDEKITETIDAMPNGINGWMSDWDLYEFARAIETKFKEKNNA